MPNGLSSNFAQCPAHEIGPFVFRDVLAQIRNAEGSDLEQIKMQHFKNTALLPIKCKVHLIQFLKSNWFNVV
jgi:hypothetical protein